MANNLVFNEVASRLQVLVNGFDGTKSIPIKVNSDGTLDLGMITITGTNLDIRPLTSSDIVTIDSITGPVTVTATDLDIRPLTNADIVTIDSITAPVTVTAADLDIRPLVETDIITVDKIAKIVTTQSPLNLNSNILDKSSGTNIDGEFTNTTDISNDYSYFINNIGTTYDITVTLQLSPDNSVWMNDPSNTNKLVAKNSTSIITASTYAPYSRLQYILGGNTCEFKLNFVGNQKIVTI